MSRSVRWAPGVLVLALVAAAPAPAARRLEIVANGLVVWSAPVRSGEAFDVSYVHSRERCLWVQHYRVSGGVIHQQASTFASFGAGMPLAPPGSMIRASSAGYTIHAPLVLREIRMMNSRAAGLAVTYRGRAIAFGQWLSTYQPVVIRVR